MVDQARSYRQVVPVNVVVTFCLSALAVASSVGYVMVARHNTGTILTASGADLLLTFGLLLASWAFAVAGIAAGFVVARTRRISTAAALLVATAVFIGLFFQGDIAAMFLR